MIHTCSTLLIRCMDFRLEKGIHHGYFEPQNMCGDTDIVSVAGAAKDLADTGAAAHQLLRDHVALSKRLHGITRVILMNHTDCGAYGGSAAFGDGTAERAKHEADLRAAAAHIHADLPDLEVICMLAVLDAGGRISFEQLT